MNPINPLQALGLLDKLVVEHGAAAIQKVHIELLRDVIKTLDIEDRKLKDRVVELENDVVVARETNQQLHARNQDLVAELSRVQAAATANQPSLILLSDEETVILKTLSKLGDPGIEDNILAAKLHQNPTKTKCFLRKLEKSEHLYSPIMTNGVSTYYLADAGRTYLVENNLV